MWLLIVVIFVVIVIPYKDKCKTGSMNYWSPTKCTVNNPCIFCGSHGWISFFWLSAVAQKRKSESKELKKSKSKKQWFRIQLQTGKQSQS